MTTPDVSLKISADGTAVVSELKRVQGQLDTFSGNVKGAAAGAIAAFSVVQIAGFVNSLINAADQLGDVADRVGTTAESLQGLRLAADDFGSSAEVMDRALNELQSRLGKAQIEGGKAAEAFERLGLSAEELAGLSTDQAFLRIADAVAAVQDRTQRAALAQEFFGKAGRELVPILSEGAAGVERLVDGYRDFNRILSNETVDRLSQTEKALGDSKTAVTNLASEVVAVLSPAIIGAADVLQQFVGGLAVLAGINISRIEELNTLIERNRTEQERFRDTDSPYKKRLEDELAVLQELQQAEFDRAAKIAAFDKRLDADNARRQAERDSILTDALRPNIDILNADIDRFFASINAKAEVLKSAAQRRAAESAQGDRFAGNSVDATAGGTTFEVDQTSLERDITDQLQIELGRRLDAYSQFSDLVLAITGRRVEEELIYEQIKTQGWGGILGGAVAAFAANSQKMAKIAQGLAIAQVVYNTGVAITKALSLYDYVGAAKAAVIGATQIAQIKSTSFTGSVSSGGESFPAGAVSGAGGTGQNPSAFTGEQAFEQRAIRVEVAGAITDASGRELVRLISGIVKEKDLIIVPPGSANARELIGG